MEETFEGRHTGMDLQREASGSRKAARKVSDLGKPCDLMASADYKVIDKLLIPDFAGWNIRFATNQLVLCYMDQSRYAEEIHARNWYEILQREGVVWGHSDPNLDPCGYRSLMVMQLAEEYYKVPGSMKSCSRTGRERIFFPSPWSSSLSCKPAIWIMPGNTCPWPCSTD